MHRVTSLNLVRIRALLMSLVCFCSCGSAVHAQSPQSVLVTVELQSALPRGIAGHSGGIVENKLICVGGTSWSDDRQTKKWHDDCFVKTDNGWIRGPSLPRPRSEAASAFDSTGLYLVGGSDRMTESRDVECLTSLQGPWKSLLPLPKSIQGAGAALVDKRLFVLGGKSDGSPQTETWSLDLTQNDSTWRSLAAFPGPGRSHSAVVAINQSIYLLGGFSLETDGTLHIFDDAYRYDVPRDQWEKLERIRIPGYAWAASPLTDTKLLIVGRVRARGDIRTDVELLDLTDGSIHTLGHLAVPTCVAPIVRMGDNRWFVFGGEPNPNRNRNNQVQLLTSHSAPK